MRQFVPIFSLAFVFVVGCMTSVQEPLDSRADAGLIDADPPAPTCLENGCCTNATAGYDCTEPPTGEGCPYPCCIEGVLTTCFVAPSYECNVVLGVDCGDGTCSSEPGGCG
jgi:hypothetical protein